MAMTVDNCRKRGTDAFLNDLFAVPSDAAPLTKRGRCSPSVAAVADLGFPLECDPIETLRLIFPHADPQVLQNYFEASGNVLDAAITAYKDYLANRGTESTSSSNNAPAGNRENLLTSSEVDVPAGTIPTNASEWVELVVQEISSASDLVDAKNRAFRILELFQKSTLQIHDSESIRELKAVKQILVLALNKSFWKQQILKLHNRMVQERSQFKQIIEKYEEQIKALESKNYVLSFHLQQANQHNSISSHQNPDVF